MKLLLMSVMSYGIKYYFGQLGSAVSAVSHPNSLSIPSLLAGMAVRETEKTLMLHKHFSSIAEMWMCSQHCFKSQIQNTELYKLL